VTAVAEAERVAFDNLVAERLDATHPNTDPNSCGFPAPSVNKGLRLS
jgi:hypothetical protein